MAESDVTDNPKLFGVRGLVAAWSTSAAAFAGFSLLLPVVPWAIAQEGGSDTVAVLRVRGDGSQLTPVALADAGVAWPRHHTVVLDTLLVAGQRSGDVAALTLDIRTILLRNYVIDQIFGRIFGTAYRKN